MARWTECQPGNWKVVVRFPVRACAWVVVQVPSRGCARGNQLMYLSHIDVCLPLFLPPPLKIKSFKKCIESRLQLRCFILWKHCHYPAERKSCVDRFWFCLHEDKIMTDWHGQFWDGLISANHLVLKWLWMLMYYKNYAGAFICFCDPLCRNDFLM